MIIGDHPRELQDDIPHFNCILIFWKSLLHKMFLLLIVRKLLAEFQPDMYLTPDTSGDDQTVISWKNSQLYCKGGNSAVTFSFHQ